MLGTFRPGDCLVVIPISLDDVRVGDVVIFRNLENTSHENDVWVHRIVSVRQGRFTTRGDNNSYNDLGFLTKDKLLGKVTHALRDGKTCKVWGGMWGFLWARCLHARHPLMYLFRRSFGCYYRWLKESRFASKLWKPTITKLGLQTKEGLLVKYINNNHTVARWWIQQNNFDCRKPFDLVIPSPLEEKHSPTHAKLD